MEVRERWRKGFSLEKGDALAVFNAREAAKKRGEAEYATRLQGVWLVGCKRVKHHDVATALAVTPSCITGWIRMYKDGGIDGLRPRKAPGNKPRLTPQQLERLKKLILAGPEANGLDTGVWTGPIVRELVLQRFKVAYSVSQIRRILHQIGFSVQYPKKILSEAQKYEQDKWLKSTYRELKKRLLKKAQLFSSKTKPYSSKKEPSSGPGAR